MSDCPKMAEWRASEKYKEMQFKAELFRPKPNRKQRRAMRKKK